MNKETCSCQQPAPLLLLQLWGKKGRRKTEAPNTHKFSLKIPQQLGGPKRNAVFSLQEQRENIGFGCGGGTAKGMSEHLEGGVDTFSTITPSNNKFPINFLVVLGGMLVTLPKTSKRSKRATSFPPAPFASLPNPY